MISHRPDPKNCGSPVPVTANPSPHQHNRGTIGKNLDQLQQPEADPRVIHRLSRFLWS